jgi:hypothetical protein
VAQSNIPTTPIPQSISYAVAALTADCYEHGLDWPEIAQLNRRVASYGFAVAGGAGAAPGSRVTPGTANLSTTTLTRDMLLSQIRNAPNGLTNQQLQTYYPKVAKTKFGPILGRMSTEGLIEKVDDRGFASKTGKLWRVKQTAREQQAAAGAE